MKLTWVVAALFVGGGIFALSQSSRPVRKQSHPPSAAVNLKRLMRTPAASTPAVPNTLRLLNSSAAVVSRPYTLSRFFAAGEVPNFPSVLVDGAPAATQCDLKTRWPDGSVQHAILSFQVTVPARGSVEIAFANQESIDSSSGLDAAAMLSGDFQLGGVMRLTNGSETRSVDVREMLSAGKFRYWLQGPVCTQVIVEDAGEVPAFDLGFGDTKPFHPSFVLTFYPGSPAVRVEFIGEIAWMSRLQDLSYSLSLLTGQPLSDQPVFVKNEFLQPANTRWRKVFWSGPEPATLRIDHNLPYLIYSRAVPNFDLTRTISASGLNEDVSLFKKSDRGELGGNCLYTKYLPTTGGRPELGIFNRWDVRYLYTFDPALEEVFNGCASVSGHVPIHFRESLPGRIFTVIGDPASGALPDALGRVASVDARPMFCSRDGGLEFSSGDDKPVTTGPVTTGGWTPDTAHQASFTYLPYLLTGDYYYLEELYFWSAWNIAHISPGNCYWCRGLRASGSGESFGIIHTEENQRAVGWVFRTLVYTALMAPDNSPEKNYFTDKLLNNIAAHEGRLNITDGLLVQDPSRTVVWEYGRNTLEQGFSNPLSFWSVRVGGNVGPTDSIVDPAKTFSTTGPWMNYIILSSLGIMDELGFPARPLRLNFGKYLVGQLTDPAFNPYLVDVYYMPSGPAKGKNYDSWAEVLDAFRPAVASTRRFTAVGSADFHYGFIALAALSVLTDVDMNGKSGQDTYLWLKNNYPGQSLLNDNPKWAIVPRSMPVDGSIQNRESWAKRFKPLRPARRN